MAESLPAINGKQLNRLLIKDGFVVKRRATHGISKAKDIGERTIVTVVPDTTESLPAGTLGNILGVNQTAIGKRGLDNLIKKYGLR